MLKILKLMITNNSASLTSGAIGSMPMFEKNNTSDARSGGGSFTGGVSMSTPTTFTNGQRFTTSDSGVFHYVFEGSSNLP